MTIPLILFACLSPFALDFTATIQRFAHPFQNFCLQRVDTLGLPPLTKGIVCGATQMEQKRRQDFLKTGVYHVLVVSGAHFITLERLFGGTPTVVRALIVTLFFLLSGGSAPALRAIVHMATNLLSLRLKLNWSWIDRLILSTSLVLSLFCSLYSTKSLLLSVICATIFSFPSGTTLTHLATKTLFSSFVAGALMATESSSHPLGWFSGALLSPLLGLILFPALLLNWILPDLNPLVSPATAKFLSLLQSLSENLPESTPGASLTETFSWAALFCGFLAIKLRTMFSVPKNFI